MKWLLLVLSLAVATWLVWLGFGGLRQAAWDADLAMPLMVASAPDVEWLDFSPDGRLLVQGSFGGDVAVWDPNKGKLLWHRRLASGWGPRFSPDGNEVLVSLGGVNAVYAAGNGSFLRHSIGRGSCSYSRDGQWVASAGFGFVQVWKADTGERAFAYYPSHTVDVFLGSIAFSYDGSKLAAGGNNFRGPHVRVWNTDEWQMAGEFTWPDIYHDGPFGDGVHSLAYSPVSDQLAVAGGGTDILITNSSLDSFTTVSGHERGIQAIAYTPNGETLISASNDRTVRMWDTDKWTTVRTLRGHRSAIFSLSVSGDGKLLASGDALGQIRIWELPRGTLSPGLVLATTTVGQVMEAKWFY